MRKIREILRLALGEGLSRRTTAAATGLPYTTVSDHLARAARAGLGWPLPDGLDDAQLEARLFAKAEPPPAASRPLPDWALVHRELRRKGVTLQLLHMEYKERQPDGYQYTQFCRHYRAWQRRLDVVMRQEHRAGEKLFVDFAGQTIPITDPRTGEIRQAQLFVAVLGASSYTYAEATPSQELPHWIAAHVHAFAHLGGASRLIVPDNLRSGVTSARRYEPEINPSYAEMAAHDGAAVIPTRPRKPRDKAKAEQGVLLAERWVLAALRHRTFFSLAEANAAIRERLAWLNARPFRKLPGSRASLFAELDRPALRPLPAVPYEFAVWKTATVNIEAPLIGSPFACSSRPTLVPPDMVACLHHALARRRISRFSRPTFMASRIIELRGSSTTPLSCLPDPRTGFICSLKPQGPRWCQTGLMEGPNPSVSPSLARTWRRVSAMSVPRARSSPRSALATTNTRSV